MMKPSIKQSKVTQIWTYLEQTLNVKSLSVQISRAEEAWYSSSEVVWLVNI